MTAPAPAPARFSVRAALGLWLVVLNRRPAAFASIALVSTLVQLLSLLLQMWFLAVIGEAVLPANIGKPGHMESYLQASVLASVSATVAVIIWLALEPVWLNLFLGEKRAWSLSWGQFGRLCLAFLILTALFSVALLGLMVIVIFGGVMVAAMNFDQPDLLAGPELFIVGFAVYALGLLVIGFVMARLIALPALALLQRRLDILGAWRATRGVAWRTFAACVAIYLVYGALLAAIIFAGQAWPGAIRAHWDMAGLSLLPPDADGNYIDPNTAFAGMFDTITSTAFVVLDCLLVAVTAALITAMARGIGVTLAQRVPAPELQTPPAPTPAAGSAT